jgi:hypothetical protein
MNFFIIFKIVKMSLKITQDLILDIIETCPIDDENYFIFDENFNIFIVETISNLLKRDCVLDISLFDSDVILSLKRKHELLCTLHDENRSEHSIDDYIPLLL